MKQALHLGLQTQLILTPQLQQSIRLLQMSTLDLEQEISEALLQNPMLERSEPGELGDDAVAATKAEMGGDTSFTETSSATETTVSADEVALDLAWGDSGGGAGAGEDDEGDAFNFEASADLSLRQHLLDQLLLTPLAESVRQRVIILIESLDEEGYLKTALDELAALLPGTAEDERESLEVALRVLQGLDPVGVGAQDLGGCLRLQLLALPPSMPHRADALRLVTEYLPLLAEREYGRLRRALNLPSEQALLAVRTLLASLNPRPCAAFSSTATQFVVPDVIVRRAGKAWRVQLNAEAMPRLRVNALYAGILREHGESPALSAQLQEARWMIRSVQQRFETILRVARFLVTHQSGWLEHGDIALRPLVLREVADALSLHESTVSRATTQKYMLTPQGLVEFKRLFSNAMASEGHEAASGQAIKARLRQLVAAEDTARPLSDQALADALDQQGFKLARRTVAKYREQLHISPAAQRKR
ncbi:MAG: RNA polymerase sigma-54 factor [Betaproteobacteria bacterium]|nr:MAG: RNA polymerase sigma-54 factor [Betaproteobacteria bacterium]